MNDSESRYPWYVLLIVMVGTLMSALDSSIVNVSLPAIMADFGSSLDDIEWVITGYMLAFATLMPLTAWLRDRIGHKVLFIASLVVFTGGSVMCGMAWNLPTLVFARVVQALGGGAITPTAMAMISDVFEPKDRGKALGYWGIGVMVGPAFGPTLGGWLTNVFGWRSIFMVNLPIGLLGIVAALLILKPDRPHASEAKPFDYWGFGFLSVFLISFLLGLSKGEHEGWTSTYILSCMGLAAIGFVGFLTVELLSEHRVMDIQLFRFPVFSACVLVTVIRSAALYGGVFLLPVFLENIQGLDELQTGLIMLPGSLVIGMVMPLSAKLLDRLGPKVLTILGLLAVATFMFMFRRLDVNMSKFNVIIPTLVRGLGIGLLFTPVMATALNHVPKAATGMASSMINLLQQVGGSLGIAILATVLSHRVKFHLLADGVGVHASSPAYRQAFDRLTEHAHLLGYTHAQSARVAMFGIGHAVSIQAQTSGFQDAYLTGSVIVLFGILAALLLPNHAVMREGPMVME
jgi:EmrB/QacA subfamily drug resistance transporter